MGAGDTVKDAWHTATATPPRQVSDQLEKWYSGDPSTWPLATERTATATLISSAAFLAGEAAVAAFPELIVLSALLPWAAPVVAAVTEVVVDKINDFLNNFGFGSRDYCTFDPQWQTKKMDDPLWIHYPGRVGIPAKGNAILYTNGVAGPPYRYGGVTHSGWGRLGLYSVTPDLRDYPWIQELSRGYGPDLASLPVLTVPSAIPGSFEAFWYPVYCRMKETNGLQKCIRLSPGDADKQDETMLWAQAWQWNQFHEPGNQTVYPSAPNAGDDILLAPHQWPLTVHRGPLIRDPWARKFTSMQRAPILGGALAQPTGMSTGAKIAVAGGVTLGAGALGLGLYALAKHITFSEATSRAWGATKGGAKRLVGR